MKRTTFVIGILLSLLPWFGAIVFADTTDSTSYSSGYYTQCDYGSCTITLSSSGAVSLNLTPNGLCTVQSDAVAVETDNDTGYTLSVTTSTTNTAMTSGGGSITTSSGTAASPVTLATNRWGYRVDGIAGFGAGPTSSQSNGSVPSVKFAGVPASNQTPDVIAATSLPANPGVTTTVWYGLCADATVTASTYSVGITYTAITN